MDYTFDLAPRPYSQGDEELPLFPKSMWWVTSLVISCMWWLQSLCTKYSEAMHPCLLIMWLMVISAPDLLVILEYKTGAWQWFQRLVFFTGKYSNWRKAQTRLSWHCLSARCCFLCICFVSSTETALCFDCSWQLYDFCLKAWTCHLDFIKRITPLSVIYSILLRGMHPCISPVQAANESHTHRPTPSYREPLRRAHTCFYIKTCSK